MSSRKSIGSSPNLKKITSKNGQNGNQQPGNTKGRKSQSSADDPLGAIVNQLEKQAGNSEHTFGDQAPNYLLHQASFPAPNYNTMQQSFDSKNRSSFKKSIADPNLGHGAYFPTMKPMNSVNYGNGSNSGILQTSGFLQDSNTLFRRQSSRLHEKTSSPQMNTSLSIAFGQPQLQQKNSLNFLTKIPEIDVKLSTTKQQGPVPTINVSNLSTGPPNAAKMFGKNLQPSGVNKTNNLFGSVISKANASQISARTSNRIVQQHQPAERREPPQMKAPAKKPTPPKGPSGKRLTKKQLKEQEKIDKLAPQKFPQQFKVPGDDNSEDSDGTRQSQKKRGRKLTEPNRYYFESEQKIASWKKQLKDGVKVDKKGDYLKDRYGNFIELSADDKQKLRNQISAQRSRANKKMEMSQLSDQIQYFRGQLREVMKIIEREVPDEFKDKVLDRVVEKMPDSEVMDDIDVVQTSTSAPIGGKNAAKKDQTMKKRRSIQGQRFTKTITKFLGL